MAAFNLPGTEGMILCDPGVHTSKTCLLNLSLEIDFIVAMPVYGGRESDFIINTHFRRNWNTRVLIVCHRSHHRPESTRAQKYTFLR